jgi:hypothetical protein
MRTHLLMAAALVAGTLSTGTATAEPPMPPNPCEAGRCQPVLPPGAGSDIENQTQIDLDEASQGSESDLRQTMTDAQQPTPHRAPHPKP